jgi:hypothetical protein
MPKFLKIEKSVKTRSENGYSRPKGGQFRFKQVFLEKLPTQRSELAVTSTETLIKACLC